MYQSSRALSRMNHWSTRDSGWRGVWFWAKDEGAKSRSRSRSMHKGCVSDPLPPSAALPLKRGRVKLSPS
jgi:hypothetical protein